MHARSISVAASVLTIGLVGTPALAAPTSSPEAETSTDTPPPPSDVADEPDPAPEPRERPVVQRPAPAPEPAPETVPPAATPTVPEATWRALKGKKVTVQTSAGAEEGELAASDGSELVLIADDGRPFTVPKTEVTDVRVEAPPASDPAFPTSPPGEEAASASPPPEDAPPQDPKEARAQRRKERREKRTHALLGAFTAHGAAYAHWRGKGVSAGYAAYAMDWGVGVNLSPGFGMYAVGGGLLGAKIDHKTIPANAGHMAFMFAFGGKYYFSMMGAGVAFSRLKLETETQKDIGLSLPMKLFGKIPLPKKLYIGIGLSYELAIVRGFGRFINGIGGQIVFGRW